MPQPPAQSQPFEESQRRLRKWAWGFSFAVLVASPSHSLLAARGVWAAVIAIGLVIPALSLWTVYLIRMTWHYSAAPSWLAFPGKILVTLGLGAGAVILAGLILMASKDKLPSNWECQFDKHVLGRRFTGC